MMRRRLTLAAAGVALLLSLVGCDPAPDNSNEQAWICAQHRPYGTGELYLWTKLDANSLKCWQNYDGCRSYQLDYEDGDWVRRYVVNVPCPDPA